MYLTVSLTITIGAFTLFVLDLLDLQSAVRDGPFGTAGKLVYRGDDPSSTYNLAIGKIILLLWEYVDILCSWGVLGLDWNLTMFVPKKVSSSGTGLFLVFPYYRSDSLDSLSGYNIIFSL